MLKIKIKYEEKRLILKWIGLLLIVHLAAFFAYAVIFDKIVKDLILDGHTQSAENFMLFVSVALQLLFCGYYAHKKSQYVDYKMTLKKAMKEKDFSVKGYFISTYGRELKLKIITFIVFQIPYAIFYAIFGYSFLYPTRFEMLYALESGIYAKIGIWPLGFIVTVLLFVTLFIGFQYLFLYVRIADIRKNSPDGFYDG